MKRTAKVSLHWLVSSTEGQFRSGHKFSRPARFDHQGEDWMHQDAWSLTIITEGVPDAEGCQSATATFLVPEAPQDWLSVGKRFTLFESEALAEGVVEQVLPD